MPIEIVLPMGILALWTLIVLAMWVWQLWWVVERL